MSTEPYIDYEFFYGISKPEFTKIRSRLATQHSLTLENPLSFPVTYTVFGKKHTNTQIINDFPPSFIIDLDKLDSANVPVQSLIQEFSRISSKEEYDHVCSMAYVMSIYCEHGYSVVPTLQQKRGKKNPDFQISGLTADVKVRKANDPGEQFMRPENKVEHTEGLSQYSKTLCDELCYDIGYFIQNRLSDGAKQAYVLFVDLNYRSLPFMGMWDDLKRIKGIVPEPKAGRVIYYCYPRIHKETSSQSFYATFIDIDPKLWEFIKTNHDTIIFRKQVVI